MSPILTGVIASGISGHLTPPWSPEGAYDALATVTLSSTAASITFAGIPSEYKHLQLRVNEQTTANGEWRSLEFNGDTGLNTTLHTLYGDGASASAALAYATGVNNWLFYDSVTSPSTSSMAGYVVDILDYANTNKYKTTRFLGGHDNNGSGFVWLNSKLWTNTSAVSSLKLIAGGSTFVANSSFALYGIK